MQAMPSIFEGIRRWHPGVLQGVTGVVTDVLSFVIMISPDKGV